MTREQAWRPYSEDTRHFKYEELVNRLIDQIYGSEYQFLSEEALERIKDSNFYYEYYDLKGQFWQMPRKLGYEPTIMPVNLARWLVKKRASWMFEVAPDVECPKVTVDPPERVNSADYVPSRKQMMLDKQADSRERIIYQIWKENRLEEKLIVAARDFFIGGTVVLKIRYLPNTGIRYQFVPVQEVFPITYEEDPDRLKSITFVSFLNNDKTVWKQTWEMEDDGFCYLTEGIYNANNMALERVIHNHENTLLDFVPCIIFPNEAVSGELFGVSYLRDLIPLLDEVNRMMSDAADSLRFNLFAVTIMLNAPPDAEKMVKLAPQEIWNVGGDGVDVKKLESGFNYAQALEGFLNRMENLIHLIGEVPDVTPDRIKGFGLVSGVALKLLYSDLVSATQQAWRVWKSRLVEMNAMTLRMLEIFSATEGFPYGDLPISDIAGDYDTRVIPHLPLPEDEMAKIQMEAQKVAASLQSLKGAMQELGEKNPERKLAEIIAERVEMIEEGDTFGKRLSATEQDLLSGA